MDSRLLPRGFRISVLAHALVLSALIVILVWLLARTQFYATDLVVLLCGALVVADLVRLIAHAERSTQRFLDSLAQGAMELPMTGTPGPGVLASSFERARRYLQHDRRLQRQSNDYLQTLLDTVPAALLVIGPDGSLRMVNRAAFRLLGEPATTLQQLPSLGSIAAAALMTLTPGAQLIVQLTDGRQLLASAAQFAAVGEPVQRLICLQRLAGELDAVEHKAWDDMARVLAHEMMNSLTPIASLSESLDALLRQGDRTTEVAAALETIGRRSRGLMSFVERYRTIADVPEPLRQRLPLRTLLADVEGLIRPALTESSIQLVNHVEPTDLAVLGDRDLLEQALINVLRNATEALIGRAGACIEIRCGLSEGVCHIDVADNGPGLLSAAREQLFVPFFTTKPEGSGIGLSLARRIAQRHGGQLQAHDNSPQGTVFRLSLPPAPDI